MNEIYSYLRIMERNQDIKADYLAGQTVWNTLVHKNESHTQMPGDSAQDASCSGRLDGMQVHWMRVKMQLLEHCIARWASTSSSTCCRRLFSALSPFWTGFERSATLGTCYRKKALAKHYSLLLNHYYQVPAERDRQRQPQETSVGGGRLYAHCGQVRISQQFTALACFNALQ